MTLRNWLRSLWTNPTTQTARPQPRLGVQQLEAREVPSASLASALGVGGTGGDTAVAVAVDTAGNSYLTGHFSGTADFDPTHVHPGDADVLTSRGGSDIFVAKYAPDDTLVWARRMGGDTDVTPGGPASDAGMAVAIDGSGNVLVAGQFCETADFGPVTLTSAGGADGFVTKLSSDGTVLWASRSGTGSGEGGRGVGVDAAGNVYTLVNGSSMEVIKLSPAGASVWTRSINPGTIPYGDLVVDPAGKVSVCGDFRGTVDFDPGTKTKYVNAGPSTSGFALRLTSAGNFDWVAPFVGRTVGSTSGYSGARSLALDGSGNLLVGGYYRGPVDFNPGSGTYTLPNGGGFVTKLNGSGGLVWAKCLSGDDPCMVNGLAVDAAGSVYVTGSMHGTTDFDPGAGTATRTTAGSSDAYVLKLTSAGNFAWVETFGGSGSDSVWGMAVDAAGTVYLAGGYNGTVDFDPDPLTAYDLTSNGGSDIFFVRLRQP